MIPVCSGLRSPAGVGPNAEGEMFTIESQGPWNGCCSLKHLKQGGFLGHPASYNWYPFVPGMDAPALEPNSPSRLQIEKKRIKELVANQLDRLRRYESVDGGWGYIHALSLVANSFVIGPPR